MGTRPVAHRAYAGSSAAFDSLALYDSEETFLNCRTKGQHCALAAKWKADIPSALVHPIPALDKHGKQ